MAKVLILTDEQYAHLVELTGNDMVSSCVFPDDQAVHEELLEAVDSALSVPETHEGALASWLGELDCNACDEDSES